MKKNTVKRIGTDCGFQTCEGCPFRGRMCLSPNNRTCKLKLVFTKNKKHE